MMWDDDREYYYLNNYCELGKLIMTFSEERETDPLLPILKVTRISNELCNLVTGYLTNDNTFHPAPIKIHFVLFDKISCKKPLIDPSEPYWAQSNFETFEFEVKLYNPNYTECVTVSLNGYFEPRTIAHQINILNIAVASGKRIKFFQPQNLSFLKEELNMDQFYSSIDSLRFRFFEHSENRVGKDNYFWETIEISNLPSNPYIKELITTCFQNEKRELHDQFERVLLTSEEEIVIRLRGSSAYSPAFKPRELIDNKRLADLERQIRQRLPAYILKTFKKQEYSTSMVFARTSSPHEKLEERLLEYLMRLGKVFDDHAAFAAEHPTKVAELEIHEANFTLGTLINKNHRMVSGVGNIVLKHSRSLDTYKFAFSAIVETASVTVREVVRLEVLDPWKNHVDWE